MMFCGACSLNFTVIVLCRGHKRIYDIQPLKVKREGGHCSFSEPASWPWPSVKVNTVPITFKTALLRSCKGFRCENGRASFSSMILVASWSEVKNSKCSEQHLSSESLKEIRKSTLICFPSQCTLLFLGQKVHNLIGWDQFKAIRIFLGKLVRQSGAIPFL